MPEPTLNDLLERARNFPCGVRFVNGFLVAGEMIRSKLASFGR